MLELNSQSFLENNNENIMIENENSNSQIKRKKFINSEDYLK